jgi:hypothetical protein
MHFLRCFVPFFLLDVFDANPIDQHHQLGIIQLVTSGPDIILWQFKCPGFQSFVIQYKPAARPMEQFDFVPGLVYENEYLPVHWRLP